MSSSSVKNRTTFALSFLALLVVSCAGTGNKDGGQSGSEIMNALGLDQSINVRASILKSRAAKKHGIDLPVGNYRAAKMVAPIYPRWAMERGKSGWVLVAYTVTETGLLEDVRIVAETPKGVFSESALRAISEFEFYPYLENGVPTRIPNAWNRFTYEIEY